jgi:hypothetical protein
MCAARECPGAPCGGTLFSVAAQCEPEFPADSEKAPVFVQFSYDEHPEFVVNRITA